MMLKYFILSSDTPEGLAVKVNLAIQAKMICVGGLAVISTTQGKNTKTTFYQAMLLA